MSGDVWTLREVADAGAFLAVYESEATSMMTPYAPSVAITGDAGDWVSITIIAVP